MKTIPLTQGKVALVDDADYEAVSQFKWHADIEGENFYAARNIKLPNGKRTIQFMHRFLMPEAKEVHHIDGNGGNNQKRTNLLDCTHKQNCQGAQLKRAGATSKFRGVFWDKRNKKWQAQITVAGKGIFLGRFVNEVDAAKSFNTAAIQYRGEFAGLNYFI